MPSRLCLDVRPGPGVCRGRGRVPTQCAQYLRQGLKAGHQPNRTSDDIMQQLSVCQELWRVIRGSSSSESREREDRQSLSLSLVTE